jgi:thymidylate synthase
MISKILPNQIAAQQTAEQAWLWGKRLIEIHGDNVISEDGHMTRELLNLHLTILEPLSRWPIEGSGWNIEGLNKYAEQLLSGENPTGFDYTYGERLRNWPTWDQWYDSGDSGFVKFDQIDQHVTTSLKEYPTTRRAIAVTWHPSYDGLHDSHSPCLIALDFLIRSGKLNLTAFFRSWDFARAAPCNMYGLAKLQERVAKEVDVPMGSLAIIAASAHIYSE